MTARNNNIWKISLVTNGGEWCTGPEATILAASMDQYPSPTATAFYEDNHKWKESSDLYSTYQTTTNLLEEEGGIDLFS